MHVAKRGYSMLTKADLNETVSFFSWRKFAFLYDHSFAQPIQVRTLQSVSIFFVQTSLTSNMFPNHWNFVKSIKPETPKHEPVAKTMPLLKFEIKMWIKPHTVQLMFDSKTSVPTCLEVCMPSFFLLGNHIWLCLLGRVPLWLISLLTRVRVSR